MLSAEHGEQRTRMRASTPAVSPIHSPEHGTHGVHDTVRSASRSSSRSSGSKASISELSNRSNFERCIGIYSEECRDSSSFAAVRNSRIQERNQLVHLNDRFASYIDRVRGLVGLKETAETRIRESEEALTREQTIRKEIESDLRLLRTELTGERSRNKAESDRLKREIEESESK